MNFKKSLEKINLNRSNLFIITLVLGLIVAAIGCSQTIAFILTLEILRDTYKNYENEDMAMEFSDSAIVTSALVPWCIAALIPTSVLSISNYQVYTLCYIFIYSSSLSFMLLYLFRLF